MSTKIEYPFFQEGRVDRTEDWGGGMLRRASIGSITMDRIPVVRPSESGIAERARTFGMILMAVAGIIYAAAEVSAQEGNRHGYELIKDLATVALISLEEDERNAP